MLVPLPKALLEDILRIRSCLGYKIVLSLLESTLQSESILCTLFKKSSKNLRTVAEELQEKGIIQIARPRQDIISDEEVVYCLNKKYFEIEYTCVGCKFAKEENIKTDRGNYNKIKCTKTGKTCIHKPMLNSYNVTRFVMKDFEIVGKIEKYTKNFGKREYVYIDKWKEVDFIAFYIEKFKDYYPKLIAPERYEVKVVMKSLIAKFRKHSDEHWRRLLKRYIWEVMKFYSKEQKVMNIFNLNNNPSIGSFFAGEGKKIEWTEFCGDKHIYCRFADDTGGCKLEGGTNDCTETIREKMIAKYN